MVAFSNCMVARFDAIKKLGLRRLILDSYSSWRQKKRPRLVFARRILPKCAFSHSGFQLDVCARAFRSSLRESNSKVQFVFFDKVLKVTYARFLEFACRSILAAKNKKVQTTFWFKKINEKRCRRRQP